MTTTNGNLKGNAAQAWGLVAKPKTPPPDGLLDYRGVAAMLGVSARTAATLAAKGELPKIRVLGSIRFARADVLEFIARSRLPQ